MEADEDHETPKAFPDNTYYLINTVADLPLFAREAAQEMGVTAHVLTSFLEGESRDAGTVLASIAREVQAHGNPFPAPCVILSSGETTTKIPEDGVEGHGGPSLELTASFALSAGKIPGACLLSVDSEGTDGTTRAAGGLTDSTSHETAVGRGVDLRAALRGHSCFEALHSIGDTVFTGNTGTNLCDFNVLYVPAARD
jgi:glycerate 2-kinase